MRPFFDLCLTFLVQKPLLRAYIFMLLDCSYFPFYLPFVSKNTGVRPEKVFKKSDFLRWSPTKGFVTFLWYWQQTKNSNLMQIWAYICSCKTCIYAYKVLGWLVNGRGWLAMVVSKRRKGGWKGGISLLPRLQGVSKACPRCVQDVSKMPSNHRNKRLVTLLGSYTASTKRWYTASCSTNNDVSNT